MIQIAYQDNSGWVLIDPSTADERMRSITWSKEPRWPEVDYAIKHLQLKMCILENDKPSTVELLIAQPTHIHSIHLNLCSNKIK